MVCGSTDRSGWGRLAIGLEQGPQRPPAVYSLISGLRGGPAVLEGGGATAAEGHSGRSGQQMSQYFRTRYDTLMTSWAASLASPCPGVHAFILAGVYRMWEVKHAQVRTSKCVLLLRTKSPLGTQHFHLFRTLSIYDCIGSLQWS